ncbi:hypothetical protein J6590_002760 [Homalodisca vitripennis]|nr:hypothetical protein J6590_002760 [Homalodisca vitripennis]
MISSVFRIDFGNGREVGQEGFVLGPDPTLTWRVQAGFHCRKPCSSDKGHSLSSDDGSSNWVGKALCTRGESP